MHIFKTFTFFKFIFIFWESLYVHADTHKPGRGWGRERILSSFRDPCGARLGARCHELWDHDLSWNQELAQPTELATQAPLETSFYLFIFERERERVWVGGGVGGEAERGRHRIQSRLQAQSCLSTQSLMWGSNPRTEIMTWSEVRRISDPATQGAPETFKLEYNREKCTNWTCFFRKGTYSFNKVPFVLSPTLYSP